MKAADVLELLDALDARDVEHWVDGGWGVDALLGEQTRQHADLDLVVARRHLDAVRDLLTIRGFSVIRDWLPTAIAFRDSLGREVDLHPVDLTGDGGGNQVLLDGAATWHYQAPVLGSIAGRVVACCPAGDQLLMHEGYEPRPVDVHDVRVLAERYDLPLPRGFRQP